MTIPYTFFPPTEEVVSDEPLILRRVVRWGDCDPAGIAYTPRFLDYVVSAHEAFISLMLGGPIHMLKDEIKVDFPVRGVEIDFRDRLPLDAQFDMEVRVGEIRNRTFDLHIRAYRLEAEGKRRGPLAFTARISPVTVSHETRAAVALPESLRQRVAAYAAAHPAHEEES